MISSKLNVLNIQISHILRVRLDKSSSWLHVRSHQHVKNPVSFFGVFYFYLKHHPPCRIHRRFPKLDWIHFPQTLISLDVNPTNFFLFFRPFNSHFPFFFFFSYYSRFFLFSLFTFL